MKSNRRNFGRGSKKRPQEIKIVKTNPPPSPEFAPSIAEVPRGDGPYQVPRRSKVRDMGILAAWIAGLCLAGGLAWFLTQPLRSGLIITTVNRTLERNGENRRLDAQISPWGKSGAAFQLGNWYTLKDGNGRAVIFSIMNDGILAPYLAFIPSGGPGQAMEPFVPLSAHADRLLGRLPQGILQTYARRVEAMEKEL